MHINKVMQSLETDDGTRCVDIFQRPDGSYGFEEYRRDVEDPRGWAPVGGYGEERYPDQDATLTRAIAMVAWLALVLAKI